MAFVRFDNGVTMTGVAQEFTSLGGHDIIVDSVVIKKTTSGTVTFKDGNGAVILVTNALADGSWTRLDLGIKCSAFEYDARSAGSAIVYAYGADA